MLQDTCITCIHKKSLHWKFKNHALCIANFVGATNHAKFIVSCLASQLEQATVDNGLVPEVQILLQQSYCTPIQLVLSCKQSLKYRFSCNFIPSLLFTETAQLYMYITMLIVIPLLYCLLISLHNEYYSITLLSFFPPSSLPPHPTHPFLPFPPPLSLPLSLSLQESLGECLVRLGQKKWDSQGGDPERRWSMVRAHYLPVEALVVVTSVAFDLLKASWVYTAYNREVLVEQIFKRRVYRQRGQYATVNQP